MLRKPHFLLLLSLVLAVLVLLALPEQTRSRVRVAVGSLFLPLFGLAGSAQATAERLLTGTTPRALLVSRLDALALENERLRLELAQAQPVLEENRQLREMLGYARRSPWKLKPARIIGRDPANWWRSVHIDVGLRHGVTTNLPVITPEGLVGRVAECSARTSRVVLVGDPNCPVAALLADTRDTGIIRGASAGDIQGTLVDLAFLPRNAVVKAGQRVETSGQGGVFPAGIRIGEIVDAQAVGAGVYLEARARLSVDLAALELVWVKLP